LHKKSDRRKTLLHCDGGGQGKEIGGLKGCAWSVAKKVISFKRHKGEREPREGKGNVMLTSERREVRD